MVFYSLSVESPEDIAGDYEVLPAHFGAQWLEGVLTLPMVDCGEDAKRLSRRDVYKKIAMHRRSDQKTDYAIAGQVQSLFANALILINRQQGRAQQITLPKGHVTDNVKIPVFCISKSDGQAISKAGEKGPVILSLVAGVRDLYSCGLGDHGQLGLSKNLSFTSSPEMTLMVKEKSVKALHCGANHTVVLLDSGAIFAFGHNECGQLGCGDWKARSAPVKVATDVKATAIGGGSSHNFLVGPKSMGLWSWGYNEYRQLGHSGCENQNEPQPVNHGEFTSKKVLKVDGGYMHSICLAVNWAQSESDLANEARKKKQLEAANKMSSVKVQDTTQWSMRKVLAAGGIQDEKSEERAEKKAARKMLRLKEEQQQALQSKPERETRTVYTWGDGGRGQMGHGRLYTIEYFRSQNPKDNAAIQARQRKFTSNGNPRKVEALFNPGASKVADVFARGSHSAILTVKGELLTFGSNEFGQLALGDRTDRGLPILVTQGLMKGEKIMKVALGQFHTLALSSDSNVYGAGRGAEAQLGQLKDRSNHTSLTLIKRVSRRGVVELASGDVHCAAKTNLGHLFMWGCAGSGRLGLTDVDHDDCLEEPQILSQFERNNIEVSVFALGGAHTVSATTTFPADDVEMDKDASSEMLEEDTGPDGPSLLDLCCAIS